MAHNHLFPLLSLGLLSTLTLSGQVVAQVESRVQTPQLLAQTASSGFIWPAQGTIGGQYDPSDYHLGLDIVNAPGTPIIAAAAGEVVFAGWNDWGLGNAVKIRHNNGYYTVYGHNQRLLVRVGDRVQQGQIIAEMGNTGFSSQPHVHFEVRRDDRDRLDPASVLPPLIGGRIPTSPVATATAQPNNIQPPASPPPVPTPAILNPATVDLATAEAICQRDLLLDRQTATFNIKICRQRGQLFYFGQTKANPQEFIFLPAQSLAGGGYRAERGSYSYAVSSHGIKVSRFGREIRTASFLK